MKFLTDRKEIAKAINIDEIPVLKMDISKCMEGYEDCYEGSDVKILTPSRNYPNLTMKCTLSMFGDSLGNQDHEHPWLYKRILLQHYGCCLHDSFGYRDIIEMIDRSYNKVLTAGQRVIVAFDKGDSIFLRMMKVSDKVTAHCSTVAELEDID